MVYNRVSDVDIVSDSVDDLGLVSKNLGLRQLSGHTLSIKYSYDLCRYICISFIKFAYLAHVGKVCETARLKRHVSIICLLQNVSNKLFPDC